MRLLLKYGGWSAAIALALGASLALYVAFGGTPDERADLRADVVSRDAEPAPTPLPATWIDGLAASGGGDAILISCLDANADGRVNAADGDAAVPPGVDIALKPGEGCGEPEHNREVYVGTPADAASFTCSAAQRPLLIVAIGGGGTELLDPLSGESLGLLAIVNGLQARASAAGIASQPILASASVLGADHLQTRMEEWIAADVRRRLDAMPCLRAVLIGHSHGGVTVTAVTSALDEAYGDRLYGVLLDRTLALYDKVNHAFPTRTPILNVYQLNEGWHGIAIDAPNVTNVDQSSERGPVEPGEGGGPPAIVSHPTLDDAPGVQERVIAGAMAWASQP